MTRIIKGALLTFGPSAQDHLHEPHGVAVIGDDGRILWRGAQRALPEAYR
jgi:hypothetical protein